MFCSFSPSQDEWDACVLEILAGENSHKHFSLGNFKMP